MRISLRLKLIHSICSVNLFLLTCVTMCVEPIRTNFFVRVGPSDKEHQKMEEQIQMLITVSGKSYEQCQKVLCDTSFDLDTAAVILLGDPGDLEIRDYDLRDKNGNEEVEDDDEVHFAKAVSSSLQDQEVIELFNQTPTPEQEEDVEEECNPEQNLLLIPFHRLQDVLEKIIIPKTIQFKQIWTTEENVIPIPGGVTICEVTSDSNIELQLFLSMLATQLLRYRMSTCFNIESITRRANRVEYLKKIQTIFSDILDVDSKRVHRRFQDHVIFQTSVVYDEDADHSNTTNHTSHVLTVTMTGLPELLLVLQDASQAIAASMSSSSSNGNSLACVPNEWSLLCHTTPYSLILLEEGSPEWDSVLENGRYAPLVDSLFHSPLSRWSEKTVASHVKCIHRIENIELWRCYCSKRDGIERLRGESNERWYWHGTRTHSPEVIAREGFDFRVANPGSYGRGAYFAHSVNYSCNGYQHVIPGSYQVAEPAYSSGGKSSKKRRNSSWNGMVSSYPAYQPFGSPPVSGFSTTAPPVIVPSMSSITATTTVSNSVIQFPSGVGPGDNQLILARVTLGKTATSNVNGVSVLVPFFSLPISFCM
jgi:hypothetical protein